MGENIAGMVADTIIDISKLSLKLIYKLLNIKEYFDINNYFKHIELKNKKNIYPITIKIHESKKGYTYVMSCPLGMGLSDFVKIKEGLEVQLRHSIDIRHRNGYIEIEVITVELPKLINYKLPCRIKDTIKIAIGESLEGTVYLDLKENPHSYVVGQTGSGKSVCTKVILTSLINTYSSHEVDIFLADLKRVELNLFANVKHCKRFVYTVADTTDLIADLLAETNRRYDLFMQNNVTDIFEYNKLQGVQKLKYQVLYIEEMTMLLEDKKKVAQRLLKSLMAIGRASGIYIICTTQRPSSDIIDNVVKSLISNRVVFKVEDTKNSIIALDDEGAELLEGKGHGILKTGAVKTEFRGYYISDNQVKQYTKKHIVNKQYKAIQEPQSNDKKVIDINVNVTKDKYQKVTKKLTCTETVETTNNTNKITDLSFIEKI